ncbi:hypothetical protein P153DRAFT_346353 [Dothidotthia symphoricarpi CBS 119687]|uniref:Uncharacterized protein n=1 Tax=Dothidotthia symphoricarpi CBS 119687 TaxID=1392245 RepID=A0A6A6A3Y0_9PLEO|nr:uncharacterized protein P153DRAFT_346353 [Dothidotthia symphoricarpi CBS 119687]KAF2126520.1 hypothetical protein P153DRAFT_346353 [Dothidotthia symphoricarpi CBS 119687]
MGIPYSREINAAFDQVTPLVAAGFEVLQTTKNISILLAVIQVLTVFFLALILLALIVLLYCVNPDLEHERQALITPTLRYIANITVWGLVRSMVSLTVLFVGSGWIAWRLFLLERWIEDVEYEGNVDVDKALEDLDDAKGKADVDKGVNKAKAKEKGKKK